MNREIEKYVKSTNEGGVDVRVTFSTSPSRDDRQPGLPLCEPRASELKNEMEDLLIFCASGDHVEIG